MLTRPMVTLQWGIPTNHDDFDHIDGVMQAVGKKNNHQ